MVEANERIYTIPLRKAKKKPGNKRAKAAIKVINEFVERHMKAEIIKLDNPVNEYIWERGAHKIPSKIKVKVTKQENSAKVVLFQK